MTEQTDPSCGRRGGNCVRQQAAECSGGGSVSDLPGGPNCGEGIRWQRVNDEPFEYAIQQGQFGDEFVKLLNGTCLRRALPLPPSAAVAGEAVAWKLVPIELTDAMRWAGGSALHDDGEDTEGIWRAILNEAPSAPLLDREAVAPFAWTIPGDDQADMNGFIPTKVYREGEFTKPLYASPSNGLVKGDREDWQPIATAPRDGSLIDVKGIDGPYGVTSWTSIARWDTPKNWHKEQSNWMSPAGAVLALAGYKPTHWMPRALASPVSRSHRQTPEAK